MAQKQKKVAKKQKALIEMFERWYLSGKTEFTNEEISDITKKYGFKNQFDVTKIDNKSVLPQEYIEHDIFIAHLGEGKHAFVSGVNNAYHEFEEISPNEIGEWTYKPSLLNESNNSEANVVSLAYNQGIMNCFLHDKKEIKGISRYDPGRTQYSGKYFIGNQLLEVENLQMELDSHAEYNRIVDIFEVKNTKKNNFAVYQIFMPFLYFNKLKEEKGIDIDKVRCNYLLRGKDKEKQTTIKIYQYTFEKPKDMSSIKLLKKKQYTLIRSQ